MPERGDGKGQAGGQPHFRRKPRQGRPDLLGQIPQRQQRPAADLRRGAKQRAALPTGAEQQFASRLGQRSGKVQRVAPGQDGDTAAGDGHIAGLPHGTGLLRRLAAAAKADAFFRRMQGKRAVHNGKVRCQQTAPGAPDRHLASGEGRRAGAVQGVIAAGKGDTAACQRRAALGIQSVIGAIQGDAAAGEDELPPRGKAAGRGTDRRLPPWERRGLLRRRFPFGLFLRQAAPDAPAFRRFAVAAVCAATARADAVFAPRDGKHTGRRDPIAARGHIDPAVGQGDIASAAAGGRRGQPDTSAGERQPAIADNKALLPDETVPPGGDGDIAPGHGQTTPAANGIGV